MYESNTYFCSLISLFTIFQYVVILDMEKWSVAWEPLFFRTSVSFALGSERRRWWMFEVKNNVIGLLPLRVVTVFF
jgi:hypothetical protein